MGDGTRMGLSEDPAHSRDSAELSDLELLTVALADATGAHQRGELAAPWGVDEMALRRAERRARHTETTAIAPVAEVAA